MNQTEQVFNSRFEEKAAKYRLYKWIALALLVVFLLCGFVFFKNDITVENLRYLVKYLDFSGGGSYLEETVIHYSSDPSNAFYVFRGDLVLVNQKSVTLYDRRGSAVMMDSYVMANPIAVCGEMYLAVYDLGGYQLRIYNSFSLLYEENFAYPIQSVSVNDKGQYCIATSQKSYHAAVYVYSADFEKTFEWFSTERFVVNAFLSDYGRLSLSTVRVNHGDLITELLEIDPKEKNELSCYAVTDQLPVSHHTDREGTLLLTDSELVALQEGQAIYSSKIPEASLKMLRFHDELCAIVQNELSVGVNFQVRVFGRDAKEIIAKDFSVQIRDIAIYDRKVYVLTHTELFVLSLDNEDREEKMTSFLLTGDYYHFGVLSENTVILCSDNVANIKFLD